MGTVDRLRKRVEPFVAWYHSTAVNKACPYMVIVGSFLNQDMLLPPPFSYLGMSFIYGLLIYNVHCPKNNLSLS